MFVLKLVLITLWFGLAVCECDSRDGPAGSPECLLLPKYTGYQWATCLTDAYIQERSNKKHRCEDRSRTYCYYQCMMEVHTKYGDVSPDCACNKHAKLTLPPGVTQITLPPWCYSPSGNDCSWYSECLEKQYPCTGTDASYAINFADKFCTLYKDHYNRFSSLGQWWIDEVRKCLQVQLVPVLRNYRQYTCPEIMDIAYMTHPGCYTQGRTSICDLPTVDWLQIFFTIGEDILNDKSRQQMYVVAGRCRFQILREVIIAASDPVEYVIVLGVELAFSVVKDWWYSNRYKRSMLNIDTNVFTANVTMAIANELDWQERGLAWFTYPGNETYDYGNGSVQVKIKFMIAPKAEFDLNAASYISSVNLTEVLEDFVYAVESGGLQSILNDGIILTEMRTCATLNCNKTLDKYKVNVAQRIRTTTDGHHEGSSNAGVPVSTIVSVSAALVIGILLGLCVLILYRRKQATNNNIY